MHPVKIHAAVQLMCIHDREQVGKKTVDWAAAAIARLVAASFTFVCERRFQLVVLGKSV